MFLRLLRDADPLEQLHRGGLGLGLGRLAHPGRRERQVLEHREMRKQVEVLEHHADLAPGGIDVLDVAGELDAVDHDVAALVLLEPVDAADHGRLARPRRPAHDDLLALPDVQIDVLEHVELAEPLVHAPQHDHRRVVLARRHHRSPSACGRCSGGAPAACCNATSRNRKSRTRTPQIRSLRARSRATRRRSARSGPCRADRTGR